LTRKALNIITLLVTLAAVSAFFLYYNGGITILQAVTDSVISTVLFTGFSVGLFQLYRFVPFELDRLEKFIVIHLTAGVLVSIFWANLSSVILPNLIFSDPGYRQFFAENFVTRFFIGLILYFTFTAFIYLIKAYFKNIESIRTEEALKARLLEAELNILKLQVNPHFIFNSLNSISALTRLDPALSAVVTEKLARFIRLSLEAKEEPLITLNKEIENIKRYIEIEQIRFGDRLRVEYTLGEGTGDLKVPSFLLLPLAENAIKHGVQSLTGEAWISFDASVNDGKAAIKVTNNTGEVTGKRPGLGTGLSNARDILRLNYGPDAGLNVVTKGDEFTVVITLPGGIN